MTKSEAIKLIYEEERKFLLSIEASIKNKVANNESIGFYFATFYYIPSGILTDEEEWVAFEEAYRKIISEILGYEITLEECIPMGNGHGAWKVKIQ